MTNSSYPPQEPADPSSTAGEDKPADSNQPAGTPEPVANYQPDQGHTTTETESPHQLDQAGSTTPTNTQHQLDQATSTTPTNTQHHLDQATSTPKPDSQHQQYQAVSTQFQWYLAALVAWVIPFGLQTVLFPWLIAVQLQESADRLGIAQMAMQLPGLFFILVGGVLADRIDPRRILTALHLIAFIPPLGIAFLLANGQLSYSWLILYALMMGTLNAFVMPARDGMLNRVANGNLQRAVTIVMGLTFGAQLIGFVLASAADVMGAEPLLAFQGLVFLLGVFAVRKLASQPSLPKQDGAASGKHLDQLTSSLKVAWQSTAMRPVIALLSTISVFYGGTFVVINPLIVRDIYGGSAFEISLSYGCFVIGTVAATLMMLSVGGLKKQGRAMMLAVSGGGLVLAVSYLAPPFWIYLAVLFGWGMCGGVAMSMGRTIMQEAAPEQMRARIMAVFSLANTGGMPIGSLMLGFLAEEVGPLISILVVVISVWIMTGLAGLFTGLSKVALGHSKD